MYPPMNRPVTRATVGLGLLGRCLVQKWPWKLWPRCILSKYPELIDIAIFWNESIIHPKFDAYKASWMNNCLAFSQGGTIADISNTFEIKIFMPLLQNFYGRPMSRRCYRRSKGQVGSWGVLEVSKKIAIYFEILSYSIFGKYRHICYRNDNSHSLTVYPPHPMKSAFWAHRVTKPVNRPWSIIDHCPFLPNPWQKLPA